MNNNKIYKNPDRGKPEKVEKFVPNYKRLGIEPQQYRSGIIPHEVKLDQKQPKLQPQTLKPVVQPYGYPTNFPPIGRDGVNLPNIGNNTEQNWYNYSITEKVVDDLDLNKQMIDNNDEVSVEKLDYQRIENELSDNSSDNDLLNVLETLEPTFFILLVRGVPLCSGDKSYIEDTIYSLVVGEHEDYQNEPVDMEDIIVLQKYKMKVGTLLIG